MKIEFHNESNKAKNEPKRAKNEPKKAKKKKLPSLYVALFAYIKVGNFVAILVRKTKKAMKVPYFA